MWLQMQIWHSISGAQQIRHWIICWKQWASNGSAQLCKHDMAVETRFRFLKNSSRDSGSSVSSSKYGSGGFPFWFLFAS